MSITVSMAGGSGGVGSLSPMGQVVDPSNSNLSNAGSVCSDQQVSGAPEPDSVDGGKFETATHLTIWLCGTSS